MAPPGTDSGDDVEVEVQALGASWRSVFGAFVLANPREWADEAVDVRPRG